MKKKKKTKEYLCSFEVKAIQVNFPSFLSKGYIIMVLVGQGKKAIGTKGYLERK